MTMACNKEKNGLTLDWSKFCPMIHAKFCNEKKQITEMTSSVVAMQSCRFLYQRTRVRIQSLATFIEHLFTVNCL